MEEWNSTWYIQGQFTTVFKNLPLDFELAYMKMLALFWDGAEIEPVSICFYIYLQDWLHETQFKIRFIRLKLDQVSIKFVF